MAAVYAYNNTWQHWAQGITSTAATSHWVAWNDVGTASTSQMIVQASGIYGASYYAPPAPPTLTKKQARKQRANDRRRGAEAKRRNELAAVEKAAKKERARELLASVLDNAQREELRLHGWFHVQTRNGERVYRLSPGRTPYRVKGEDGRMWSYCIHPSLSYPDEDTAAALKLLLDHDEEQFLRIANATRAHALV